MMQNIVIIATLGLTVIFVFIGAAAFTAASARAWRRARGGESTGAAWLTFSSGRAGVKLAPASQRRASITGGAKVVEVLALWSIALSFYRVAARS